MVERLRGKVAPEVLGEGGRLVIGRDVGGYLAKQRDMYFQSKKEGK
jgi:hypothetical protein